MNGIVVVLIGVVAVVIYCCFVFFYVFFYNLYEVDKLEIIRNGRLMYGQVQSHSRA